ncbi:hypothetical protein [Streptomyces wuyuanensis]
MTEMTGTEGTVEIADVYFSSRAPGWRRTFRPARDGCFAVRA